jgi:hypothetical protein
VLISPPIPTSAQVRNILVQALELDLIGLITDDMDRATEIINSPPTRWYLTGFLCPQGAPLKYRIDSDRGQDDLDSSVTRSDRGEDSHSPEKKAARTAPFPSSVGLTFLLKDTVKELEVTVTWGDYEPSETGFLPEVNDLNSELTQKPGFSTPELTQKPGFSDLPEYWQRTPHKYQLTLELQTTEKTIYLPIPDSNGL